MKVNSITLENNKKLNFKGLNAQRVVNNVISNEAPKIQKALIPLTAVPVLVATVINSKRNEQNEEIQHQDNSQETLDEKFIPNFIDEEEISPNLKQTDKKMPFVEKPVVAEATEVDLEYLKKGIEKIKSECEDVGLRFRSDFVDSRGNKTNSCINAISRAKQVKAECRKFGLSFRRSYVDSDGYMTRECKDAIENLNASKKVGFGRLSTENDTNSIFGDMKERFDNAIKNSKLGEFLDKAKEKLTPENITAFFQILGFIKGAIILAKSLIKKDKEMEVKGVVCILDNAVFPIKSAIIGMAGDMFEALGIKAGGKAGVKGAAVGGLAGRITGVATANKIWEKKRDKIVKKIYDAITGGGDGGGSAGGLIGYIKELKKSKQIKKDLFGKDDMSDLKYIDESKSKLRADNIDFGDMKGYKISVGKLKDIVFAELFPKSLFTSEELEQMKQQILYTDKVFQKNVSRALQLEKVNQVVTQTVKETKKESVFSKLKDKVSDVLYNLTKNADTTSFWDKLKGKEKIKY